MMASSSRPWRNSTLAATTGAASRRRRATSTPSAERGTGARGPDVAVWRCTGEAVIASGLLRRFGGAVGVGRCPLEERRGERLGPVAFGGHVGGPDERLTLEDPRSGRRQLRAGGI